MKLFQGIFFCLLAPFFSQAMAQQLDGTIEGKLQDSSLAANGGSSDFTNRTESKYDFTGSVRSWANVPLENVRTSIYVIARDQGSNSEKIVHVIRQPRFSLKAMETLEMKFGSYELVRTQTKQTIVTEYDDRTYVNVKRSKGGLKYLGCVMEIYHDEKLVKVVENVSGTGLKAYENKVMDQSLNNGMGTRNGFQPVQR